MKVIGLFLILMSALHGFSQGQGPISTKDKSGHLIGITSKELLLESPFKNWFIPRYDAYRLQTINLKKLKALLKGVKIKVFMATWCKESKARLPILMKILDEAEFDLSALEIIAVNRRKKTPNKLEKGFDLRRIPTFIFYRNDREIGRFVEDPKTSVEADILKILKGRSYIPAYHRK